MNEEKQNKTYYKETFCEVHAPKALAERVKNMSELKSKKKTNVIAKGLAVAAAAAIVLFASGNGIAYATTGASLWELIFDGPKAQIVLENDRVYIVDGDVQIDVTEDLKENGQAVGTYEKDGETKDYCIWNPNGQYILDIRYYSDVKDKDGLKLSQTVYGLVGTLTPTPKP